MKSFTINSMSRSLHALLMQCCYSSLTGCNAGLITTDIVLLAVYIHDCFIDSLTAVFVLLGGANSS